VIGLVALGRDLAALSNILPTRLAMDMIWN
jgi:hypothetical protein